MRWLRKPKELTREDLIALEQAYQQLPKAVLQDLHDLIQPHQLSFVQEDPHGRKSAYNEGLRAVWLHIMSRREDLRDVIAHYKEPFNHDA